MSNANKELVRRFLDEVVRGNRAVIEELVSDDIVAYDPASPEPVRGRAAYIREAVDPYLTAFDELEVRFEDQIAEGDKVVSRFTTRGRHVGEMMGIAATGTQVVMTGIDIHRIEDDQIVEEWSSWDMHGLMQQLGAIPAPAK